MEQKHRNGGVSLALGKPKITYVEGRCVGGGSEVNAGLFFRTPPEVLESWHREFGVEALSPWAMAPHFEAVEKDLKVARQPEEPAAGRKLREGAEALGLRSFACATSFRLRTPAGGGEPKPQRGGMTRTLIPWILEAGGRLLPDTRVRRLRREGSRWLLRCLHSPVDSPPREIEVVAEDVFLACGAVQTPALLRRSGIRRNVGNSLAMHASVKVTARFAEEVNDKGGVPTWTVDEFAPRFHFTCALSSPAYLALEMLQYPEHFAELEGSWRQMAVYSARTSGGHGYVRNVPGHRDPAVYFRLDNADMAELSDATRWLCKCLFAAGAESLFPSVLLGEPLRGVDELSRLPHPLPRNRTNLMTIHLSSSCPMGEDQRRCATDSFGRVHETDHLYLADASLLCTSPTVNPQGSIMAVVRRNALHFLSSS
jgi:choline dehydrogenase-like flavoprotein